MNSKLKLIAVAVVAAIFALGSRQATAQSFFYVPPGYGNGYYYGIDVGHGVGFGYGAGVGIPVAPEQLMGSATGPALQPQPFWNTAPQSAFYGSTQAGPTKPLPAKSLKAKKGKGQNVKLQKLTKAGNLP